jgi:hypothetical protein
MAGAADDEGLAAARGHPHDPLRWFFPPFQVQVFECANVMHLDLCSGAAEFAGVSQKPLNEF